MLTGKSCDTPNGVQEDILDFVDTDGVAPAITHIFRFFPTVISAYIMVKFSATFSLSDGSHLASAILAIENPGEHIWNPHNSFPAPSLTNPLYGIEGFLVDNRLLRVFEIQPLGAVTPCSSLGEKCLFASFEIDSVPQIIRAFQNVSNTGGIPFKRIRHSLRFLPRHLSVPDLPMKNWIQHLLLRQFLGNQAGSQSLHTLPKHPTHQGSRNFIENPMLLVLRISFVAVRYAVRHVPP